MAPHEDDFLEAWYEDRLGQLDPLDDPEERELREEWLGAIAYQDSTMADEDAEPLDPEELDAIAAEHPAYYRDEPEATVA